jgi:hypothetical protein
MYHRGKAHKMFLSNKSKEKLCRNNLGSQAQDVAEALLLPTILGGQISDPCKPIFLFPVPRYSVILERVHWGRNCKFYWGQDIFSPCLLYKRDMPTLCKLTLHLYACIVKPHHNETRYKPCTFTADF